MLFWWMFQYVVSREYIHGGWSIGYHKGKGRKGASRASAGASKRLHPPHTLRPPHQPPQHQPPKSNPKPTPPVHIFLSPRFARVVDLLWLGPVFRFYARLYLYFLLATFSVLLSFTPLPQRIRTYMLLFPFSFKTVPLCPAQ